MRQTDEDRNMDAVRVLIFGGTSEGRELAEYASAHRVPVLVSVVSEYGESMLEEDAYVRVRQGALGGGEMEALLCREMPKLVLDATHPYAKVVSEQVETLCVKLGIPCKRVVREESGKEKLEKTEGIDRVASVEEAVSLLSKDREPVLLTTGSKELEKFVSAEHLAGRIYARVLPDSKVLAKCEELGIGGAHLIAMQGPFLAEMNRALIHQTGAGWLVTKESGGPGGFHEKICAARECGCRVIVIERPVKETGISLEDAKLLLDKYSGAEIKVLKKPKARRISLIGMGMGGGSQLTLEAAECLKHCDAVLGAPRMLEDMGIWCRRAKQKPLYQAEKILEWLKAHPQYEDIAVVYSGDTGFYSGSGSLAEKLKALAAEEASEEGAVWQVQVYPGISSVSSLCARMQASWDRMHLASAHGRSCDVVELVRQHKRLFLLLGGSENLNSVCKKLCAAGYENVMVTAGVRMGYHDERLLSGTAAEFSGLEVDELTAVVLERTE